MLLIGSRAICYHLPDFRQPQDWDLIATDDELEIIKKKLPANKWKSKTKDGKPPTPPKEDKLFFRYEKNLVEVARTATTPYWDKVYKMFADAPTLDDPVLGPMRIAPLDYLLLTKQCGLMFPITHWHKNLKDVYVLRDIVETVSAQAAQLWPDCVADSARMFEAPIKGASTHWPAATKMRSITSYPQLPSQMTRLQITTTPEESLSYQTRANCP